MKRITIHTDDDQIITIGQEWCHWQADGELIVVPLEMARQAIAKVARARDAQLAKGTQ